MGQGEFASAGERYAGVLPPAPLPLCAVSGCTRNTEVDMRIRSNVYWPSGRVLAGSISYPIGLCEAHFERLCKGENI